MSNHKDPNKADEQNDAVLVQSQRDPEANPAEGFAVFVTSMADFTGRELARRRAEIADQSIHHLTSSDALFELVVQETRHELFERAAKVVKDHGSAAGSHALITNLWDIVTDTSRLNDPFANAVVTARREAAVELLETGLELEPQEVWDTLRDWSGTTRRRSHPRQNDD